MTDISELVQRIKAAAVRAKTATEEYASGHMSVSVCYAECEEFNRLTDGPDNILALTDSLETALHDKSEQSRIACELFDEVTRQRLQLSESDAALEKAQARIAELEAIRAAAEKLVRCKGHYHSEQNYRALAAMFGVTTPDLPPLGGESDDVTVKLPALYMGVVQMGHAVMVSDDAGHWFNKTAILEMLTAAGIKWESE
ncbi:hypothetical protein HA49_08355 [Tatumella morbirosei]|uniref:Ead/Ea22-like family protein n=1 Tax=Tatumella morbirosei TaxID=642227 RepID=A0A095TEY1_9GAMM|nr:hypothetical protein HA49_08355 [Tatumella morbirosei]